MEVVNNKDIIYSKIYILLSSIAKSLLSTFNCIYFYNEGFSVTEIVIWLLVVYICYVIYQPFIIRYSYKLSNKINIVISLLFFLGTYLQLIFFLNTVTDLVINAILFSVYSCLYWNINHTLGFKTLTDKKIGRKVGILIIIGQIAEIVASLVSAFILDYFSIIPLFITSSILMIISTIYIFKLKEKRRVKSKDTIITYFKTIPKTTLFHIFLKESSTVMSKLFSLYLFIYVSNTYSFAGVANFFLGIAGIIFTYFLSKKIDEKRESYLLLCVILICAVYLLKINITTEVVLVIVFIEGFIKQFYKVVTSNNYYLLGNNLNKMTYICGNEVFVNISRIIIILIGYFLTGSLPKFMYFCIGLLVLSGFVPFKIKK